VTNTFRELIAASRGNTVNTSEAFLAASADTKAYFTRRVREDRRQALMEDLRSVGERCNLDSGEHPTRDRDALAWRMERRALRRAACARLAA
jgi:hypothetical protein